MTSFKKLYTLVGAAALMVGSGCGDLEVTNPNNPDIERALASPADVKNLAISSFRSWYRTSTYIEPYLPMTVTADIGTSNFGNFGMRFNNLEPRTPYENSSAGGDREVARAPWDFNYSALGAANDAIKAIGGGIILPAAGTSSAAAETEKYLHLATFAQAATIMNLGLIFDKAFIIDETFDPNGPAPELKPFADVSAAAVAKWEALATAAAGKTHTYPPADFPIQGGLTSARLSRIANTMAAATMAFTPRNAAQAAAVNWAKVAQLADKGIGTGSAGAPFDFTVVGTGTQAGGVFSEWMMYGNLRSWLRVDHRLINLMDGTTPPKFNGTIPPQGTSTDARYGTDFVYLGAVIGDAGRGIWMQSVWFHQRYTCCSWEAAIPGSGPSPYVLAAESDLIRAEALIRSGGSRSVAAALINNSRVGRGKMSALTGAESDPVLFAAIDYERQVELMYTNGWDLFRARHGLTDRLQAGTWRHLPIPAKELETLGLPIYTFGGAGKEL